MKIRSITIRIPSPRTEPTPAEALRELLATRSTCTELQRRLAQK